MKRGIAMILCTMAAACTAGGGDASSGEIVFQLAGEREEVAVYETLVESFEEQHEGIDVRLVPLADKDDHLTRLTTSFAAGDPPDVFLVNFREYSQFVRAGAVEALGPHLAESGIELDDYFEQPIEAFTFDGQLQCMPQNVSNLVVYYNVELFERAGLDRPPADWSWEDLRNYAGRLSDGEVDGIGISPELIRIAPFVWSNGGDLVDDLSSPQRLTLDEPRARQAFAFVVSLARSGLVPSETEVAAQDLESRFAANKLGMLLESRKETPAFREVLGLEWDVAPLPRSVRPASILHSDAYCVAATTERLEDAVEFVGFATGEEGQIVTALGGRTVPSLRRVARSSAFLDPSRPPAHPEVFLDQIPFLRRTPVVPTWPEIEDLSEEIIRRAFYEPDYAIDDALEDLERITTPLLEDG